MAGLDDVQTVLGGVTGYRMWRLGPLGGLYPTYYEELGCLDEGKEWHTAVCAMQAKGTFIPHTIPLQTCSCGFYAVYEASGMARLIGSAPGPFWYGMRPYVIGAVSFAGRVVKGAEGVMRGERMKILALLNAPDFTVYREGFSKLLAPANLSKTAAEYGAQLLEPTEFFETHPLQDREGDDGLYFSRVTREHASLSEMRMVRQGQTASFTARHVLPDE